MSQVWIVSGDDNFIRGVFTTPEAADAFVAQDPAEFVVTPHDLLTEAPAPWTYWHRGASVYPDGQVEDWTKEHTGLGADRMEPVDDHLEPWNGHTQGHCGLHISIFGTDREQIEVAFQRQLASALSTVNGRCACGKTDNFQTGWWNEPTLKVILQ